MAAINNFFQSKDSYENWSIQIMVVQNSDPPAKPDPTDLISRPTDSFELLNGRIRVSNQEIRMYLGNWWIMDESDLPNP